MNFEHSEGLDFDLSEEEIQWGIEMANYPLINKIFASFQVISYFELSASTPSEQLFALDA